MSITHSPVKTRAKNSSARADTPFVNPSAQTQKKINKRDLESVKTNLDLTLGMEEEILRLRNELGRLSAQFGEYDQRRREGRGQDEVMGELQALRAVCEQQQQDIARLRAEIPPLRAAGPADLPPQANGNAGMLDGLIRGMQSIKIDIPLPKFGNDVNLHPREFLESFEKYLRIKRVGDDCKMLIVESALEGRAKVWYNAKRAQCQDYEAFKTAFLSEFFSIPVQVRMKSQWASRRHTGQSGPLQTFFLKQITEAQYFNPALDPYELNYTVVQQLPVRVRESLVTADYTDTNAIAHSLSQLDMVNEERDRFHRPPSNQNNNYTPNHASKPNSSNHYTNLGNSSSHTPRRPNNNHPVSSQQISAQCNGSSLNRYDAPENNTQGGQQIATIEMPCLSVPPPTSSYLAECTGQGSDLN